MRILLLLITSTLLCLISPHPAHCEAAKIGVLMWHETPHDQEALDGFAESLALTGLAYSLQVERAHGNENTARQILQTFQERKVDLILTISTRGTQLAQQQIKDIPILFTAVTNPVSSGIVANWKRPGGNVTGSSNWIRAKEMLQLFKQGIPSMKRLGVLYDPNNPVPVAEIEEAREVVSGFNIDLIEETVSGIDGIAPAFLRLTDKNCDTIWIPREKLLYQNMNILSPLAIEHKIPLVSSTKEALLEENSGAFIAVLTNYRKLGRLCVPAAIAILNKETTAGDIPVALAEHHLVIVNANAARTIGYVIPPLFLARADEILVGFSGQKVTVPGTGDSQELLRKIVASLTHELQGGEIEIPDSVGSTGGIRALLANNAELARIARPLKENEKQEGLQSRLFAFSPVVFVVHESMTGVRELSSEQIRDIYQGSIDDWKSIGGPAGRIYPISRESGDSSLRVLLQQIKGFPDPSPVARVLYTTSSAVDTLEKYPNTIGFLPLSMARDKKLRILRIDKAVPFDANFEQTNYPLLVPFAIVHRNEQLSGLANYFINFLSSPEGKKLIREFGAFPIP